MENSFNNDELKARQKLLSIKCPHGKSLRYDEIKKEYVNTCDKCDYLHTLVQVDGAMGV